MLTQSCATFNAASNLTADQRGASRVGQVDIGAFELNNSANGGTFRAVLPTGNRGSNYNYVITPNNGSFNYSVTGGALPDGISLTANFAPSAVVSLGGVPQQSGIFDFSVTASDGTNTNVTDYRLQILAPTAAAVSVSGRVLAGKRGLINATVIITDSSGNTRTTRTNSFGYYLFENVEAGQSYIFQVQSKRFRFPPQVVTVNEDVTDLIFHADDLF